MPRRVLPLLGALASAFLLSAAVPASAAEGYLIVNGSVVQDPAGCLRAGDAPAVLRITNATTATAVVFATGDCTDRETAFLVPGTSGIFWGASVLIDEG
ncbi:hypothetical protein [Streptomyces sp. CAU 1734]|uniref:hypothetical protein n=1 Tax=Streptomyces sp. CAU 1734 TaxID=3140360 RepID=UPI003261B33F